MSNDREAAVRVARAVAKGILLNMGVPEIAWIVDCSRVEQAIWCDFWQGAYPDETEETLKWCLGLPAQERDAQLGILRRLSVGKAPTLRPGGHPGALVEAFLSPDNDRVIGLVQLARLAEARRAYIEARFVKASLSRKQRQRLNRKARRPESLPDEGFSNTVFGRYCARLAKQIQAK